MVPDSVKEDVNVQAEEKGNDFDVNNYLDPFELYPLLNKKNVKEKMDKSNGTVSIPFPPGITPSDETEVECDKKSMGNNEGSGFGNKKGESGSIGSRKSNKIYIQRTGGSLLIVMEELIKDGEVIVMGDFNEVRFKNERFGSLFHVHGADAFNRFILQANLQKIPLGGCSFTWCHRSEKNMSKLDQFLMSEGLLGVNPNFSALTLD
nr:RNA-directed DNA polymerase, eukaryota [Tanacetum cinerariifolium]